MKAIGESVDHRNRSVVCENLECPLLEDARDNSLHPARQIARDVGNGFALTEARARVVQISGRSAQALDRDFKGYARAQRGLLENHREEAAAQSSTIAFRLRLHIGG